MTENPNIGPVNCLEVTVAEFHQRRRHLADSLQYIFEAAEASAVSDSPILYARIDTFARQELISSHITGSEMSLAHRIFSEIEKLGSTMSHVQAARQNAGSFSLNQGVCGL